MTSYIVMLLRTWDRSVARVILEPAIILMLNDAARQAQRRRPPASQDKPFTLEGAGFQVNVKTPTLGPI